MSPFWNEISIMISALCETPDREPLKISFDTEITDGYVLAFVIEITPGLDDAKWIRIR